MSLGVVITGASTATRPDGLPAPVRSRAARAERLAQLALAAGAGALAAAGLACFDGPPRPDLGVVLGTAFGCFLTNAAYQRRLALTGPAGASPRLFAATVSNAAAGELAIACRLGGPAITLSAGAASGLVAVGQATELLDAGAATAIVAGGMDAVGEPLEAWARDGGFDAGRPLAEAAAAVVLEPAARAVGRGAPIVGAVRGAASGFEPDWEAAEAGAGLAAAVRAALAQAGVDAGELALVVSAAPPPLARLEQHALAAAGGGLPRRSLAPKVACGETLGAAGVLGVLAALGALAPRECGLVLDVCPSGHVAACVVAGPEAAA
jgi:3-oxoacyl-[acyl-carrier-protein] synthase II